MKEAAVPLRVVTTTYIGGTEREALDRLVRNCGAEVKVQYDAARTRLHAKAWLFHRHTGFDTAYVGSSNLSTSALLEGVEWNVRLSTAATPALMQKFRATFDSYWNSSEFEPYDPDRDRDRLDDALNEASGRSQSDRVTISISGLQVRPFPYQQEMLDALDVERIVHDRHRNLVVAATGTGKTVIAALDYRRFCERADGKQPSLLFVAHRKEILEQSLRTYREVLSDTSFGELYVGGARPERWKHVFASVLSLHAYGVVNIPADAYDIIVIDEFHHAEAKTYRRLIELSNRSSFWVSQPLLNAPTALTCAASSMDALRPSFASGMRLALTSCALSITSRSLTAPICAQPNGLVEGTTRSSCPTSSQETVRGPRSSSVNCATRSPTLGQ